MGFFDLLKDVLGSDSDSKNDSHMMGMAPGGNKKDGSHDHRTNTGNHRTPSQKEGDRKRTKHD